ncbi:hypothetical protein GW916_09060, partial [bacterium]|nr:hypothetical protein [bacterium]
IPDNAPVWDGMFVFSAGPLRYVAEDLAFPSEKTAEILPACAAELLMPFIHQGRKKAHWWFGLKSAQQRLETLFQGVDYIVSDLKDRAQNEVLHFLCKKMGIRHTVIDNKELSDTWFMSLIDSGSIVAAISTRGNCAFYAKKLREELQQEFQDRAPLARTLARLRNELLPQKRRQGLKKVYDSTEFLLLARAGKEKEALSLAQNIIHDRKE